MFFSYHSTSDSCTWKLNRPSKPEDIFFGQSITQTASWFVQFVCSICSIHLINLSTRKKNFNCWYHHSWDPHPPHVIKRQHMANPSPLKSADVLYGWSLIVLLWLLGSAYLLLPHILIIFWIETPKQYAPLLRPLTPKPPGRLLWNRICKTKLLT